MNIARPMIAILGITMVILNFAQLIVSADKELSQGMPDLLLHKTFTDSELGSVAYLEGGKLMPGQLVLVRKAASAWVFGILKKQLKNDTFEVQGFDRAMVYKAVKIDALKAVLPFWSNVYQPTQSLNTFEQVIDERLAYYKKHGAPDGHGSVVPAGSKIAVIGDLLGDYSALQQHLLGLHTEGLLGNNFELQPNCYLVCLGDYAGFGPHGVEVFNILLHLQQANPGQVYLLAGDHEAFSKGESDGFKKEFREKFGNQSNNEKVDHVWQKLVKLGKLLPHALLLGLQMPSTHNYDFLVFCHGCFEHDWRPEDFMARIVKSHIDHDYELPEALPFYTESSCEQAFVKGQVVDDDTIAAKKKNGSAWTKDSLQEFFKHHGTFIDSKNMFRCCLRALLRGNDHITGGLARLKNVGLQMWKRLKDKKTYEIEPCSVFTCISGSQGLSKFISHDNAFGLIEAGRNGHWYITAQMEQV